MNELHDKIVNYFSVICAKDQLSSSYLFVGSNDQLLWDVVKTIVCSRSDIFCGECSDCGKINEFCHPDIMIIEPQTISIKIDAIRNAQRFLAIKPYQLSKKIVIIKSGESLTPDASNAFLKTLEEPPANAVIIINVSQADRLLPTIVSRCRKIYMPNEIVTSRINKDLLTSFLKGEKIKIGKRDLLADFFGDLARIIHAELANRASGMADVVDDDISRFFGHYTSDELEVIIDRILQVWMSAASVNENLALNIISANMRN